ncbi:MULTISPECIES: aminoglycoside phosphotransferase family protein [unclassified Streptomyces]|uniref:aminoglycoside phosphotransferase family protein n=1 Tax=unclassified Streptomyces TaxID=2593676 RepID=UPI002E32A9C1|nr:aminoglycoside phosphotransferase family protein [Streptomyces sp. NBC_01268]
MIHVPEELAASQAKYNGAAGRAFVAALPALTETFLDRWDLDVTGEAMHGVASLVLPVRKAGTPAVLKLQLLDEESEGEAEALRVWNGDGSVRLLDHDPETGTMLLERAGPPPHPPTHLSTHPDPREAVRVLADLLATLTSPQAPAGLRTLSAVATRMLADTPAAAARLAPDDAALLTTCAAAVRDVLPEPGDRLLHWDLHYDNILAAERAPWLSIDPKPLSGDPGFDLLPALTDLWNPDPAETLWRFDLLTDRLDLDRTRARAWTLGRVLQNALWDVEDGEPSLAPNQVSIARTLLTRGS